MATYLYDVIRQSSSKLVVIFDYTPQSGDELHVKAGDEVKRKSTIDWWEEVETQDGRAGFVPKTYLALPNTLEAATWYFPDVSRAEAIELLMKEESGTYLVRPSSIDKQFALSVRTNIPEKQIVHYQISRGSKGYYIHENLAEISLKKLLSYYQNDSKGQLKLAANLTKTCPKYPPSIFQLAPRNIPISRDEITRTSEIGSGHFGKVYQGYFRQFKIAIKELKDVNHESYRKELLPLIELCHKNVVKFYGACKETRWMIFEFVDFCLKLELARGIYNENQLLHIASQIANGMAYVHSLDYVHRDLAARNVLITINMVAKVADFGLSRKMDARNYYARHYDGPTPFKWEAIESLKKGIYDKSTDVWSFGVMMYEIYSEASIPYENIVDSYHLQAYLESGNRLKKPLHMPDKIYEYVFKFWHSKPKNRPTFVDIHKFLLKFKLPDIPSKQLIHVQECVPKAEVFRHGGRTTSTSERYPNDPELNNTYFPYGSGELTLEGKRNSYRLGKQIRKRYDNYLGKQFYNGVINSTTSDTPRTQMTLQSVHASLFPSEPTSQLATNLSWQPISYRTIPKEQDDMLMVYQRCPKTYEFGKVEVDQNTKELYDYVCNKTGLSRETYNSLDSYNVYDTILTQRQWGYKVPKWAKPIYPEPLRTESLRLWNDSITYKLPINIGPLLKHIFIINAQKIENTIERPETKMFLYSCHDSNIATLLGAIGYKITEVIEYNAVIYIELHSIKKQHFIKMFYQNGIKGALKQLEIKNCGNICPLKKFNGLTRRLYYPYPICE